MDSPFVFNKHVTGKYNIGRRAEATILANLLGQGENVAIYEPPKTGKMSLVQQTFYNMKVATQRFSVTEFSLINIRTVADLLLKFGSTILKGAYSTPDEYAKAVAQHLEGTHFVFDPEEFNTKGMVLSLNWDVDKADIEAVFRLPYLVSREKGQRLFIVLKEFQNVMQTEDGDAICAALHGIFENMDAELRRRCSYIFVGSRVNAMKDIFEVRKLFYRRVEHLKISTIDTKDIVDHISRGFLSSGKVIDRDLALGMCKMFSGNIWYINHFASICDSLSKGYMTEPVLREALDTIISIHEPRFLDIVSDLTTFQLCLLRAILDGHTKFSSAEVIRRYNLNSSANVRRLKDALCKKEIVTFEAEDRPVILDPLFEYWVRTSFFGMEEQ